MTLLLLFNRLMSSGYPEIKSVEGEIQEISGKFYNTHTLFNKHQLYHNGKGQDINPELFISSINPSISISSTVPEVNIMEA